jgi:hypothetical protein
VSWHGPNSLKSSPKIAVQTARHIAQLHITRNYRTPLTAGAAFDAITDRPAAARWIRRILG